jgi:hypothetical protein
LQVDAVISLLMGALVEENIDTKNMPVAPDNFDELDAANNPDAPDEPDEPDGFDGSNAPDSLAPEQIGVLDEAAVTVISPEIPQVAQSSHVPHLPHFSQVTHSTPAENAADAAGALEPEPFQQSVEGVTGATAAAAAAPAPAPAKGNRAALVALVAVAVCVVLAGCFAWVGSDALKRAASTLGAGQSSAENAFDLEECDVTFNFNLPLDGADVTPFVVKIEGTNALGGAFSQTYLAQPAQEFAATLPLGEFTLTFETSPIFENGAIWDVSQMSMHFLVQTVSDTLPQTDGGAPTFTQIAAQDVPAETVAAMRQALIAAGAPEADAAAYVERITSAQDAYARAAQIQSWVGGYYTETPVQGAEINPFYQVCINSITDGTVTLALYRADTDGQWYNCVTGITAPFDEATNSVSFSYAQDEYGQSGKGKIVFGEGCIMLTVEATLPAGEASAGTFDTASAATSGTLTLESGFASVFDAANIVVTTGTQDAA